MELPIPKSRSGWFAALLLLIFCFYHYYVHLYEAIYNEYSEQFYIPTLGKLNDWKINVQIPKYISVAIPGWIYVQIINDSDSTRKINFRTSMNNEQIILLPSNYKENLFQRNFSQIEIHAHSAVYFRIQFGNNSISQENCSNELIFYINDTRVIYSDALPCPQEDTSKALKRSIIENLLLPPWSNTIIPALVFVLCYLSEKKSFEDKKVSIGSFLFIVFHSALGIFTVYQVGVYWLGRQVSENVPWSVGIKNSWVIIVLILLWVAIIIPDNWKSCLDSVKKNKTFIEIKNFFKIKSFKRFFQKNDAISSGGQKQDNEPSIGGQKQDNEPSVGGQKQDNGPSVGDQKQDNKPSVSNESIHSLDRTKCPDCRESIDPQSKQCGNCGYKFDSEDEPPSK